MEIKLYICKVLYFKNRKYGDRTLGRSGRLGVVDTWA